MLFVHHMARSKSIHIVSGYEEIEHPNSGENHLITQENGMIDLSHKLSQKLGRTIKQGQNFRVIGVQCSLRPKTSGIELDPETGIGIQARFAYVPTTKASANAWRDLNKHYWKQSGFRAGLGGRTRYDEFELAMYRSQANSTRTSRVYVGGLNDPSPEYCTLLGEYDDEDGVGNPYDPGTISIEALYNAKHPVPDGSALQEDDLLFDDSIQYKDAKFNSYFPPTQYLWCSSALSNTWTVHDGVPVPGFDYNKPTGGSANNDWNWLPSDNHVDCLAGLMTLTCWGYPTDTSIPLADSFYLYWSVAVEGWSPLTIKPKSNRRKSRKGYRANYKRSRGSRYGR